MPSERARVTVYLDAAQAELLERFCAATGESRSAALGGVLTAAGPMLAKVAELAELMREAPDELRATFAAGAEQLEAQYEPLAEQAGALWAELEKLAAGPDDPRLVIRGSES